MERRSPVFRGTVLPSSESHQISHGLVTLLHFLVHVCLSTVGV